MIRQCEEESHIERFLLIITRVLESSRHKGAIEAAGAALGKGFLLIPVLVPNLREELNLIGLLAFLSSCHNQFVPLLNGLT